MAEPRVFDIHKRMKLGFLGKQWAKCWIDFVPAGHSDLIEINKWKVPTTLSDKVDRNEDVIKYLQRHFVAGKGVYNGEIVDMTAEDLANLPIDVLSEALGVLINPGYDPNS